MNPLVILAIAGCVAIVLAIVVRMYIVYASGRNVYLSNTYKRLQIIGLMRSIKREADVLAAQSARNYANSRHTSSLRSNRTRPPVTKTARGTKTPLHTLNRVPETNKENND